MAVGGLALGLGQGLERAAGSIPFYAQQKQEAQQMALRQAMLDRAMKQNRAAEAAQIMNQMPGGVPITPQVFKESYQGTPAAARLNFQPGQESDQTGVDPWFGAMAGFAQMAKPGTTDSYVTTEPFNQWKAITQAQTSVGNTQARVGASIENNQRTNETRQRIADKADKTRNNIASMMDATKRAIAAETDATRRQALQATFGRLSLAQYAVEVSAARARGQLRLGDAKLQDSTGYTNANMMGNLGLGQGAVDPELDAVDEELDDIDKNVRGLQIPSPQAPTRGPRQPQAGATPPLQGGGVGALGLTPPQ